MKTHPVYLIAAVDDKLGIGKAGKLPWNLKKDLAFFQRITTKTESPTRENMVIMGHHTWGSLPASARPLPGRRNVVLSRDPDLKLTGVQVFLSLKDAFESADELIEKIFVIGGAQVFREAIRARNLKGIYLTRIKGNYGCDTAFPPLLKNLKTERLGKEKEGNTEFEFWLYRA